jgi:hypothetical protein
VGLAPAPLARPLGTLALGALRSRWAVIAERPRDESSRPQGRLRCRGFGRREANRDFDQMARAIVMEAMVIVRDARHKQKADPTNRRARETRLAGLYVGAF